MAPRKGLCEWCGSSWVGHPSGTGRRRRYCSPECCQKALNRQAHPLLSLVCPCGKAFTATMKSRRWCSEECRTAAHTTTRNHLRRIGTRRDMPELITVAVLGERDGWTCHLCLAAVDPAATYPDPTSGSIDHLVPVSDGGPHTLANVALAHLSCNVRRGRRAIAA